MPHDIPTGPLDETAIIADIRTYMAKRMDMYKACAQRAGEHLVKGDPNHPEVHTGLRAAKAYKAMANALVWVDCAEDYREGEKIAFLNRRLAQRLVSTTDMVTVAENGRVIAETARLQLAQITRRAQTVDGGGL